MTDSTANLSQKKIRLALADDDASARVLLVEILQSLGHEVVVVAVDGAELVDQCVDGSVDLVLVDLDMPRMDGLAAAEVLSSKGIPVILVSGHPDVAHVVPAHEPIVACVAKPVSVASLRGAIEGVQAALPPEANGVPQPPAGDFVPSAASPS